MSNDFDDFTDEEVYDIVTMTGENGEKIDFFVIDGIEVDKDRYLLVVNYEDYDKEEVEATILKECAADGEDVIYEFVENDEEYNKVIVLLQDNDGDYEMQF